MADDWQDDGEWVYDWINDNVKQKPHRGSGRSEYASDISPHATDSKSAQLHDYPHYTDSVYNNAQTIFGRTNKQIGYDYDDRLRQWDYKKADAAREIALKSGKPAHSVLWYEAYLSAYYDKKIVIDHIMAGCNTSSGYPYLVFGYREDQDGDQ